MNKTTFILVLVVMFAAVQILHGEKMPLGPKHSMLNVLTKRDETVVRTSRACIRDRFGRVVCSRPTCRINALGRRVCVG